MKKYRSVLNASFIALFLSSLLLLISCSGKQGNEISTKTKINRLTRSELKDGWTLLFDGKTFSGWRGLGRETIPDNWKIEDGCIRNINKSEIPLPADNKTPQLGDLTTISKFDNFELYFEWKILKAGNSGIKYNVSEELSARYGSGYSALGFEYQLLDDYDEMYKGLKPSQFTASLYDMIPAGKTKLKPVGEFNSSRIVVNGNHCEQWLNGEKIVEFEFGSALLDSAFHESKFKNYQGFQEKQNGHIVLQNHTEDAWFRNIKICLN